MKKFIGRIIGIISVLILGYQQFCYADMIGYEPIDNFTPYAYLIGFIGVIVLVISAISFFILKSTVKKQSIPEYGNEKLNTVNSEKLEKNKNIIQIIQKNGE